MKYESTRSPDGPTFTFQEVLLAGYAPDGGLFMPVTIPKLDHTTLMAWSKLSYPDLVAEICKLYISSEEFPHSQLTALIKKVLRPDLIAKKTLSDSCIVLELYHGPTLAFKDLAMSVTAALLDNFLAKKHEHLNIIVSTSGDTGAAAIEAIKGSRYMDVFVLYPLGRVTEIQELQMATAAATADNVHLFGLKGTSDDGDDVMKAIFEDKAFTAMHHVSNVNSINWCRVMVQAAHHFYAYFQARPQCDGVVEIVCPTGAAGNLAAGSLASAMGLPVKLVAATNENDLVHQMIEKGSLTTGTVHKTLASAMDIQMPYNVERILHIISNPDKELACKMEKTLASGNIFELPDDVWQKVRNLFGSFRCTDDLIKATIKRCWDEERYLICPHTATALAYHFHQRQNETSATKADGGLPTRVCLATASYVKFPEALHEAGVPVPDIPLMETLRKAPQKVVRLEDKAEWVDALRSAIESVTAER